MQGLVVGKGSKGGAPPSTAPKSQSDEGTLYTKNRRVFVYRCAGLKAIFRISGSSGLVKWRRAARTAGLPANPQSGREVLQAPGASGAPGVKTFQFHYRFIRVSFELHSNSSVRLAPDPALAVWCVRLFSTP